MFAYLRSFISILLICFYTVLMGAISLLVSIFDVTGKYQHLCARIWCRLIAITVGMKVHVHGIDNLDLSKPAVYMSNHQSYMDIPVLFANLPLQFHIFAKKELFRIPFMGWHLKRAGHIAVDRNNRQATSHILKSGVESLKHGTSIVVFPEGTRKGPANQVKKFKSGAFKIAQKVNAPIVPITIVGTRKVLSPDLFLIQPGEVHMYIDPPIQMMEINDEINNETLIAQVQKTMNVYLNQA